MKYGGEVGKEGRKLKCGGHYWYAWYSRLPSSHAVVNNIMGLTASWGSRLQRKGEEFPPYVRMQKSNHLFSLEQYESWNEAWK